MKKLVAFVLSTMLAVTAGVFMTSCGKKEEEFKFGLICLHDDSSTYDKNFIDAANEAVRKAGLKKSQFIVKTGVAEDKNCDEAASDLVDQGCNLIFADSFGHGSHILAVAKENPDVEFCHATGVDAHTANVPNFHNAFASIYEGRYLAGVVAGMKLNEMIEKGTKINNKVVTAENAKIGYVGAFTYAEVISGYTSFYLGAKSVCPTVTMDVQFTGSWYDVSGESEAAKNLIKEGCNLISQHADSMGAPSACEESGVPNVAYNVSTKTACPETYLVASRINWEPYFTYIIKQAKAKYEAKKADSAADVTEFAIKNDYVGTVTNGSVELLELGNNVAEGTEAKLAEVKKALANGTLNVFDVNNFTVTVVKDGENKKNVNAEVDAEGHLISYMADVDLGDLVPDKQVVEGGVFKESFYRSAPYFDLEIDGITRRNVKF